MLNIQGTFYEVGRESGYAAMRPITTHKKKIIDFCTWRGLLVLSGTKMNAKQDDHYFNTKINDNGLWFGSGDDSWKMGKPVGVGGVWKDTEVKAGKNVTVILEVNTDITGWHLYKEIKVRAEKTVNYTFPEGYSAHWIRAAANKEGKATVRMIKYAFG